MSQKIRVLPFRYLSQTFDFLAWQDKISGWHAWHCKLSTVDWWLWTAYSIVWPPLDTTQCVGLSVAAETFCFNVMVRV